MHVNTATSIVVLPPYLRNDFYNIIFNSNTNYIQPQGQLPQQQQNSVCASGTNHLRSFSDTELVFIKLGKYLKPHGGRDSSVGIATRCELDGPEIESRSGRDFPHPSRPALGPTQPPIQWVPGPSRGVKRPGSGIDHPPPSKCRAWRKSTAIHLLLLWACVAYSRAIFTFTLIVNTRFAI